MPTYRIWQYIALITATASILNAQSGWSKSGSNPEDYDMGTAVRVAYTGTSSGYIKSSKPEPKGFGTYMQMFDATEYRGKRLRLSAYIKSENIANWAGMWMRIDGDQKTVGFDNMQDRPIKGTQAWTRHEIVLDVDVKATKVAFGILLAGKGAAWIDDVVFETVSDQVPVTGQTKPQTTTPRNLDFESKEEKIAWITAGDTPQDYDMGTDMRAAYAGTSSGYIKSSKPEPKGFGTYMQMFDATEYRGKRLRLSAYIKSENIANWAGMWMRIDGDQKTVGFDNMQDRPIKGTQAWTRHEIVLDVDAKATKVAFGILLAGKGAAWIDDVVFETVSDQVPVTGQTKLQTTPRNLDFESKEEKIAWITTGDTPQDYDMGTDMRAAYTGASSGYIKSSKPEPKGFGTYMQIFNATEYRGKRLRLSAHIKSENIQKRAGMWMWIESDQKTAGLDNIFRNMQDRPIKGTQAWTRHEIVLDVDHKATEVAFGILLEGKGAAWIDDIVFEVVSDQVPLTGQKKQLTLRNLDFEGKD